MPLLTRLYIKTSLLYLAAGLLLGLLMAIQAAAGKAIPGLFPVYLHLVTVGWLSLLIFGVVFWMFPKFTQVKPRGSEVLAWATYLLMNAGLIIRAAGEPLMTIQPGGVWGWLLALSALLQWLGSLLFVANTWPRVKEK